MSVVAVLISFVEPNYNMHPFFLFFFSSWILFLGSFPSCFFVLNSTFQAVRVLLFACLFDAYAMPK